MDETLRHHNPNPLLRANPLSKLFFCWVNPVFTKGFKRQLEVEDMYNVADEDTSEQLGDRLEREWNKELEKKKHGGNPSLLWAFIRMFGVQYMLLGIIVFFEMDESFELSACEESFVEVRESKKCDQCNFTTNHQSSLNRHKNLKHTQKTESEISKVKSSKLSIICDQCGKKFKSMTGLRSHDKSVHKKTFKHICAVCKRGFNGLWNYKGHLASHHPIMKEVCKTCGAKYQYRKSLLHHITKRHSESQASCLTCSQCNDEFADKDSMRYHANVVHKGYRYICKNCGKPYKWRSSLLYHNRSCKESVSALSGSAE